MGPADEPVRLGCARRQFNRLMQALDGEIDRLFRLSDDGPDEGRIKTLTELIRQTQKALLIVLEFESRLDGRGSGDVDGALDLEAARDEITRRLARLAGRGCAEGVY